MQFLKLVILISIVLYSCENEKSSQTDNNFIKSEEDKIIPQISPHDELIVDTIFPISEWSPKHLQVKFENGKDLIKKYSKYISDSLIDTVSVSMVDHNKSEIRYLGILKLLGSNDTFHVLTDFTILGIGIMPSPRGNSKIFFMSTDRKKGLYHSLNLPEELPHKIENNQLVFQHDSTKIRLSIAEELPLILCIPEIGCN